MSDWLRDLLDGQQLEGPVVRVAISGVLGSAPREAGTCMFVGAQSVSGSIGGGRLEQMAIESALAMLAGSEAWQTLRVPLGPAVGQCCGGMVDLWLERIEPSQQQTLATLRRSVKGEGDSILATIISREREIRRRLLPVGCASPGFCDAALDRWVAEELAVLTCAGDATRQVTNGAMELLLEHLPPADTPLVLFGAGHVGKALAPRLAGLPFVVRWVDGREGVFPDLLPPSVRTVSSRDPLEEVERALPGTVFLVMTHSHALDYDLCRAILARGDFCFAGLIGSDTKAARFAHRLAREGIAADRIGQLVCPIGIAGIDSKRPEAIAIGVCAQLLRLQETDWDGTRAHERGRRVGRQPAGNPASLGADKN